MLMLPTVFNALQPGIFMLSAWDILGVLQLEPSNPQIVSGKFLADGDTRWLNRGAYDLMGVASAKKGVTGLPEAIALFDTLPKQLKDPLSYLSRLNVLLDKRQKYNIATGQLGNDIVTDEGVSFYPITWTNSPMIVFVLINWKETAFSQEIQLVPFVSAIGNTCETLWPTNGTVIFSKHTATMQVDVEGYGAKMILC